MDREKVISGLKYCTHTDGIECPNCPYWHNDDCVEMLNADVLSLLNEQEAAYQGAVELLRQKTILFDDAIKRLKEQEAVVHPEPSCEMTYITDCCCDLCGVQLIREDNFCRCCGKRIEWKER